MMDNVLQVQVRIAFKQVMRQSYDGFASTDNVQTGNATVL